MGIQVKELTSGKRPWEKEFIDFEFDGKHVSEFGLVVVSDGDRLSMDLSAPFTDETSEVNGVDGQLFWGTKRNAAKRQFKLTTDGMSWNDVAAFKKHFQPGRYGKLIEDSEFGKYCYARVADQPIFTHIPFKKKSTFNKVDFNTNEFKGEITITFVMDSPWKYGIQNYIEESEESERMVRLASQYGIPLSSSWEKNVYCSIGDDSKSLLEGEIKEKAEFSNNNGICFYNPSETPCAAKLTMNIPFEVTNLTQQQLKENTPQYITSVYDDICAKDNNHPYCRILQSEELQVGEDDNIDFNIINSTEVFRFTSPFVIYAMNKAIELVWTFDNTDLSTIYTQVEEILRDEIHHNEVLQWMISGMDNILRNNITGEESWQRKLNTWGIHYFYKHEGQDINSGWAANGENFKITVNSEDNTCSIKYKHNIHSITPNSPPLIFSEAEEKCGDITLSKYIKLDGGNKLDGEGNILTYYKLAIYRGGSLFTNASSTLQYKYTYL